MGKLNGYLVDNTWVCTCGAFNAAYKDRCGKCNTVKDI